MLTKEILALEIKCFSMFTAVDLQFLQHSAVSTSSTKPTHEGMCSNVKTLQVWRPLMLQP